VRIVLKGVPSEFLTSFRPQLPVVLGGLLPHEMAMGFVRARVKRHRWHRKVLKSNDPLIFSVGWRRFQSLPVYVSPSSHTNDTSLPSLSLSLSYSVHCEPLPFPPSHTD